MGEWVGGGPLPPTNTEIKSLAKLPDGRLAGGTKSGGVFISNKNMTKWDIQAKGLYGGAGQDVKSMLLLDGGETFLVGTKDGVFRSTDNGQNFFRTSDGLLGSRDTLDARFFSADPMYPNRVHLATKGGYFLSEDGGFTWTLNNNGLADGDQWDVKAVAVHPDPYTVIIGAKHGLFRTGDPVAGNWELTAPDLVAEMEFKAMAFNSDYSSLYLWGKTQGALSFPDGTYRTDDLGDSFFDINLPSGDEVKEFGLAPSLSDPNEIMTGDKRGNLYISFDRGAHWEEIFVPGLTSEVKALLRDPEHPDEKWYMGTKDGFYFSTNAGTTWNAMNEGLVPEAAEAKSIVVDPNNSMNVYVGTKTGLWYTQQGAETLGEGWIELTQEISTLFDLDVRRVLIDYANDPSGNTIYLAAKFDLFKYVEIDGSRLWIDSSKGIPPAEMGIDKDIKWIEQDPDDPTILYACRRNRGEQGHFGEAFRSTDGGANWIKISDDAHFSGEPESDIKNITIIDDRIYLGTKMGVFRGDKNASLPIPFEPINNGLKLDDKDEIKVETTAVSPEGHLYIATKSGLYVTHDSGDSWIDITGDLPAEDPKKPGEIVTEGVYLDPFGRLWVGAGKGDGGVFFTSNPLSGSWVDMSDGLPEGKSREAKVITSAPSDPTRFYFGSKAGTFARIISEETDISAWRLHE